MLTLQPLRWGTPSLALNCLPVLSGTRGRSWLLAQRCLFTLALAEEGCRVFSPGEPRACVSAQWRERRGPWHCPCPSPPHRRLASCRPHGLPGRQTLGGPDPHDPVGGHCEEVLPGGPQPSDHHGGPRTDECRARQPDPLQAHLILPTPRFPESGIFPPLLRSQPTEIFLPEEKADGFRATRYCKLIIFFKILKQQEKLLLFSAPHWGIPQIQKRELPLPESLLASPTASCPLCLGRRRVAAIPLTVRLLSLRVVRKYVLDSMSVWPGLAHGSGLPHLVDFIRKCRHSGP